MVMSIMYLARVSRPDILFPTTYLATKASAPKDYQLQALKRILRYLNGTADYALTFSGTNVELEVYAYASHGMYEDGKGHHAAGFVVGNDEVIRTSQRMRTVSLLSMNCLLLSMLRHIFAGSLTYSKNYMLPIPR